MANEHRRWRNPNWPVKMGFPTRVMIYIIAMIVLANLIAFYLHGHLPLSFVLLVSILEIVGITIYFAFWVSPYKLKW
jgi:hypothetical protein